MTTGSDDAVWLDSVTEITWTQLVSASGLPEGELRELVRYGAFAPRNPAATDWTFEAHCLSIVRTASRLKHDYELDAYAVSVVLSYVERIEALQAELRELRARLG